MCKNTQKWVYSQLFRSFFLKLPVKIGEFSIFALQI